MCMNKPQTFLWRIEQVLMSHKIDCGYFASHKLNEQEFPT